MKKFLKILLAAVILLILAMFLFVWISSDDLPAGETGAQADALAKEMYMSLNGEAWEDLSWVAWTFKGIHDYEWSKGKSTVLVKWGDTEATFNTQNSSGSASKGGKELSGKDKEEALQTAIDYFNNDSFWLYAPFKLSDDGAELQYIDLENSDRGLLVTYTKDGSTPGDSYLWTIAQDGKPKSVRMWTSIIPLKGAEASWENWQTLEGGALVAIDHHLGPINVDISNLRSN